MSYYQHIFEEFPLAKEIWEKKYRYKDEDINETWCRVAKAVASIEEDHGDWEYEFEKILLTGRFQPGGRITNGSNTDNPYLMNCFVLDLNDSLEDIYETIKKVAIISKKQGGCGFSVSKLRPKGFILSDGGESSGPISWLHVFDASCGVIKTGSQGRRAAMIAIMDIDCVDIEEFIDAKREEGKLTNFNISVAISDAFIDAVLNDKDWDLKFEDKVYKTVKARYLWDKLAYSGWMYNDPGILWVDTVNRYNSNWFLYKLRACNPCGELALPAEIKSENIKLSSSKEDFGEAACCLGNINLHRFVIEPFADKHFGKNFNLDAFKEAIESSVRFLDDVLEVTKYPYESNRKIATSDRRIGLNPFNGIGSALAMLKIPYDSQEAREFIDYIGITYLETAYSASIDLAKEKGMYSNLVGNIDKFISSEFISNRLIKYFPSMKSKIEEYGIRNCAIGSIPPSGTNAIFGGNFSNGCEPIFSLEYVRKVRQTDGSFKMEIVDDYAWRVWKRTKAGEYLDGYIPEYFKTARQISGKSKVDFVSRLQYWLDGCISNTTNLPENCSLEEYKDIMLYSWKLGMKGFTSFRDGTREGVLTETDTSTPKHKENVSVAKYEASGTVSERPIELSGKTFKLKDTHTQSSIYCVANYLEQNGEKKPWEVFLFNKSDKSEFYAAIGVLLSLIFQETDKGEKAIAKLAEISSDYGYIAPQHGFVKSRIEHLSLVLSGFINSLSPDAEHISHNLKCPDCGEMTLIKESGCNKCTSCGYSKCG